MPVKEKEQDEYELIAVSPLRKLEKRIEQVESSSSQFDPKEIYRELVDIVRMNQQIVDELAKANDALRIELSKLPSKIEELVGHLNELLSYIKASASEEFPITSPDTFKPLVDKLNELVETNRKIAESNQAVLSAIEEMERKMKRSPMPPPVHPQQMQKKPQPYPIRP